DAFIAKSVRHRDGVKHDSAYDYNKAAKAYHLAQEVKKVSSKNEKEIEQYMLSVQQLFDAINQHAAVDALDSHSIAEQSRLLVSAWQQPVAAEPDAVVEAGADEDAGADVSEDVVADDATAEVTAEVAVESDETVNDDATAEDSAADVPTAEDDAAEFEATSAEDAGQDVTVGADAAAQARDAS